LLAEHAYQQTRADLRSRRSVLGTTLARHGLALDDAVLDDHRRVLVRHRRMQRTGTRVSRTLKRLDEVLNDLDKALAARS
jgi:NTE family protein